MKAGVQNSFLLRRSGGTYSIETRTQPDRLSAFRLRLPSPNCPAQHSSEHVFLCSNAFFDRYGFLGIIIILSLSACKLCSKLVPRVQVESAVRCCIQTSLQPEPWNLLQFCHLMFNRVLKGKETATNVSRFAALILCCTLGGQTRYQLFTFTSACSMNTGQNACRSLR